MSWEGVSGTLHDGRAGVHLFTADCPTGCYELALPTTGSEQERQDAVDSQLAADDMDRFVAVSVADGQVRFGAV